VETFSVDFVEVVTSAD